MGQGSGMLETLLILTTMLKAVMNIKSESNRATIHRGIVESELREGTPAVRRTVRMKLSISEVTKTADATITVTSSHLRGCGIGCVRIG